jgi:uncharacterized protein DUF4157
MEPRFGRDFSDVWIRIDSDAARAHQARAFTHGSSIVFDAGAYAPSTAAGQHLLAHELAHVVQQGGQHASSSAPRLSTPSERAEVEAVHAADAAMAGRLCGRLAATLHAAPPGIYREGPGPTFRGKKAWEAQQSAVPAPPVADPNASTVLPWIVKDATWEADAVLSTAGVDAASDVGAAIKRGKTDFGLYAANVGIKLGEESDQIGDYYKPALFEAGTFSFAFGFALVLGQVTYGQLARFVSLTKVLKQSPEQKANSIMAWIGKSKAAPLKGKELKAAEAESATAFHEMAAEIKATHKPENRTVAPTQDFAKWKPANFRQAILERMDYFKGAKEEFGKDMPGTETGRRFDEFRSAATLKKARTDQAKKDTATFTTCIEFQGQVIIDAMTKLNLATKGKFDNYWFSPWTRPTLIEGSAAENEEARKEHPRPAKPPNDPTAALDPQNVAWHYASPGMTERPIGGDIVLFSFAYDQPPSATSSVHFMPGMFSHMGFLRKIVPGLKRRLKEAPKKSAGSAPTAADVGGGSSEGGTREVTYEDWVTVDGGGGVGTRLNTDGELKDKDGKPLAAGSEEINENHRTYFPDTNLIAGEPTQDGPLVKLRHVYGWVDVDKLV